MQTNKKIILHCGAPETGSISFQHLIYANRARLAKAGFHCPEIMRKNRSKDDIRGLLGEIGHPENRNRPYLTHARDVIEKIFATSGAHTLILSGDHLLGKPFTKDSRDFMPRAVVHARMIAEVLQGYEVEVRYFVREFESFLPAFYVQQVRMGLSHSFDNYLKRCNLKTVSWRPVIAALQASFGAEHVAVFEHSELVKGPFAVFSKAFPDVMDVLGDRGRNIRIRNISIGTGMIDLYRRWNRIANRVGRSPRSRGSIQNFGRRYLLMPFERFSNSDTIKLAPDVAKAIAGRYEKDMAMLRPITADTRPIIGLGASGDAVKADAIDLITKILGECGLGPEAIGGIATLDGRAKIKAVKAAAEHFGVPVRTFDAPTLEKLTPRLKHPSENVFARTGCHGVAEAAALAAAGPDSVLIVEKRQLGKVTAALAR